MIRILSNEFFRTASREGPNTMPSSSCFLMWINYMHIFAIARTTGFHSLLVFGIVLLSIGQGFLKVQDVIPPSLGLFA